MMKYTGTATDNMFQNLVRQAILDDHHRGNSRSIDGVLHIMLQGLGFQNDEDDIAPRIYEEIGRNRNEHNTAWAIHHVLLRAGWEEVDRDHRLKLRAQAIVEDQLWHHVLSGRVLDYGGGDGRVLDKLMLVLGNLCTGVVLYDPFDYRAPEVKRNNKIVYTNDPEKLKGFRRFDTAIVNVVLHHADDPVKELRRLFDLGIRRLVIIESIISPWMPLQSQAFADWFYNRVPRPWARVPVPGTWRTTAGWREALEETGWKVIETEDLGFDQKTVPEHHYLFVVERKRRR